MNSHFLRFLLTGCAAMVLSAAVGRGAEPAILAKARARLGPEAALTGLKSIHYVGTLTTTDPADPTKTVQAKIEMFFQKPGQQRITATYEKFIETTALDDYEGWTRVQDATDATRWRLTLLDAEQIKRLRANTWETLSYFRGLERMGGRIEDKGTVTVDGVVCQKISFTHSDRIVFNRYFEVATGRLVLTDTESGATLRESGELVAGGIRFPKSLLTTTKSGTVSRTVTLTYDKVTVNEVFPANYFTVPPLARK